LSELLLNKLLTYLLTEDYGLVIVNDATHTYTCVFYDHWGDTSTVCREGDTCSFSLADKMALWILYLAGSLVGLYKCSRTLEHNEPVL